MQKAKEVKQNIILLNNLFNGRYISENIGGEIINMYQADNSNFYVYVSPFGNIRKKWDNRIKYILFSRSIGNSVVKVIGKAEIEEQINLNASFSGKPNKNREITKDQRDYIDNNRIKYGGVKLINLGSWSEYFVTFKAKAIYKAKKDIYLAPNEVKNYPIKSTTILKNIKRINNQSQKLYIGPDSENYKRTEKIIKNPQLWEDKPVGKVKLDERKEKTKSFLSIIKKENDELVISNLLAYFLENKKKFWSDFVKKVLKITNDDIINKTPKITRESIGNIDLFIEVGENLIIIENKIKSGINGKKRNSYSQLEKYFNFAEKFQTDKFKQHDYFILRPNYNNENFKDFNEGDKYKEIKYADIYGIIKNYNSDFFFNELKEVVKKHSSEYDNELFKIMNERFIDKIKSIKT